MVTDAHLHVRAACQYFRIKKVEIAVSALSAAEGLVCSRRRIPPVQVGADTRADVAATRRAINRNTIGIVASSQNFPTGVDGPESPSWVAWA